MIQISIHPKLLTPIHPLHSGVVPSPPSKTESECSVLLTIATFSLLPGSLGFLRYPKGKNVVMLELGSLTAALPRSRLSRSGPQVHLLPPLLKPFPFSRTPPLLFLPWRRRLGERRPSPLPATSASSRYAAPAPSLSLCCARPQTLTKLSNPVTI